MNNLPGTSGLPEHPSSALSSLSDDQLARLSKDELLSRLKQRESECMRLMRDRAQLMKDVNKTLQLHLSEVRGLREVNQALQKDNQELRDLSCFLDDDRIKARKIAKEWQKFGKYTSTVMRQEVTAYQMKLYELEQKQESLVRENLELKELCLYLDSERELRHPASKDFGTLRSRADSAVKSAPSSDGARVVGVPYVDDVSDSKEDKLLGHESVPNRGMFGKVSYSQEPTLSVDQDGIDVDVSQASNSSTGSFSSNLDSNSSNVETLSSKK